MLISRDLLMAEIYRGVFINFTLESGVAKNKFESQFSDVGSDWQPL